MYVGVINKCVYVIAVCCPDMKGEVGRFERALQVLLAQAHGCLEALGHDGAAGKYTYII